jgi:hypothetical protein
MSSQSLRLVLVTGALALLAAPAAQAKPVSVNLRVEGVRSTIFDGPVTTDGHVVHPAGGPAQSCDGSASGGAPGPTALSALDDGAKLAGFTWAGDYFPSLKDYFVTRVAGDSQTSSQFWGEFINGEAGQGGCTDRVGNGTEVLWAFDAFSKAHTLRLSGPTAATAARQFAVRVTDSATRAPLAGSRVGGATTTGQGVALLTFPKGIYNLKAERGDSVRSNQLKVCVDPAGAAPCTSTDGTAPKVTTDALPAIASDRQRSRRIRVSWKGDDGANGSGITSYRVERRAVGEKEWIPVVNSTKLTRATFRGHQGFAYDVRVSAVDRAANRGTARSRRVSIPVDDRDRDLFKFSKGWRKLKRKGAWGGTVRRSARRGAAARIRVTRGRAVIVGRKLRRGGKLRVTIGKRTRTVRLKGRSKFRTRLYTSRRLGRKSQLMRLKVTGGRVEIDAVAVKR